MELDPYICDRVMGPLCEDDLVPSASGARVFDLCRVTIFIYLLEAWKLQNCIICCVFVDRTGSLELV